MQDLKSLIHNRIVITKRLLSDIALAVQSTVQEHIYRECLKRVKELTTQDLHAIKTKHGTGDNTDRIKLFWLNLDIIKQRTHSTYTDLCTWETQTRSQDKDTDETSKKIEANEPLQVSPTKNINLDAALTFDREPLGLTPPQDPNISKLEIAKTRIHDSINAARDLLAKMTTATLHPVPISTHFKDIAMMTRLTYNVDAYLNFPQNISSFKCALQFLVLYLTFLDILAINQKS